MQHTSGYVVATKETRVVRVCSYKAGQGEVVASLNPLWQPEFPESRVKMEYSGNAPIGVALRYSFFELHPLFYKSCISG